MQLNRLFDFFEQIYQKADVKAAFGEPETIGQRTIIPVARVGYGLGLGFGEGERPSEEEAEAGCGGGGGGTAATPIAVVEVTGEGTQVIPIVDWTKLALAGLATFAWNLFWINRILRILKGRKTGR